MGFNAKDAINSARDIATHAVERSADIVDSAAQILKGNVAEGTSNIVHDSLDIAGHTVAKVKEMARGRGDDVKVDEDTDEKVDEIAGGPDEEEAQPDEA